MTDDIGSKYFGGIGCDHEGLASVLSVPVDENVKGFQGTVSQGFGIEYDHATGNFNIYLAGIEADGMVKVLLASQGIPMARLVTLARRGVIDPDGTWGDEDQTSAKETEGNVVSLFT